MKKENKIKGNLGESLARKLLEEKGMKFIESNYTSKIGEIDLIMEHCGWLIFVEVKLKKGDTFGNPEEMIGHKKLCQIRRVAENYIIFKKVVCHKFCKFRIDAVCIVLDNNNELQRITHYKNLY